MKLRLTLEAGREAARPRRVLAVGLSEPRHEGRLLAGGAPGDRHEGRSGEGHHDPTGGDQSVAEKEQRPSAVHRVANPTVRSSRYESTLSCASRGCQEVVAQVAKRPEQYDQPDDGEGHAEGTHVIGKADPGPGQGSGIEDVGEDAGVGRDGENEFRHQSAFRPVSSGASEPGRRASSEVGWHAPVDQQQAEKRESEDHVSVHEGATTSRWPPGRTGTMVRRGLARLSIDGHSSWPMKRILVPELMDQPAADAALLEESLDDLAWMNRYLGVTAGILHQIGKLLNGQLPGRISVLDVGAGGGDVMAALGDWCRRRGVCLEGVAVDSGRTTVRLAAARLAGRAASERTGVVCGDALALPFRDRHFDIVIGCTFLHHLEADEAVAALTEMARVSAHGGVVTDLRRSLAAYLGASALARTLWRRHRYPRHDAPASVRAAYTLGEARTLARRASLDAVVEAQPLFRWALRWRRS